MAKNILDECQEIFKARGDSYGDADDNLLRTAMILTLITGKKFTARDVGLTLLALKLVRMKQSPQNKDHYIDAINYIKMTYDLNFS